MTELVTASRGPASCASKIWVISLADAVDRKARFERSALPCVAPYEFFDAHKELARPLRHQKGITRSTHGRSLRTAELGCYSSHYALWQWLADSACDQMLVLEDDVCVDWAFIDYLLRHDFRSMGIPYLRLFAKIPARWRYVASPFLDRYRHLIRFTSYALGTQAYLITKPAAVKWLQAGRDIRFPIDVFMDRYWEHGIPDLAIYPFPVLERFEASSIGAGRFEPENVPLGDWLTFQAGRLSARVQMLRSHLFERDAHAKWRLRGARISEGSI